MKIFGEKIENREYSQEEIDAICERIEQRLDKIIRWMIIVTGCMIIGMTLGAYISQFIP